MCLTHTVFIPDDNSSPISGIVCRPIDSISVDLLGCDMMTVGDRTRRLRSTGEPLSFAQLILRDMLVGPLAGVANRRAAEIQVRSSSTSLLSDVDVRIICVTASVILMWGVLRIRRQGEIGGEQGEVPRKDKKYNEPSVAKKVKPRYQ